MLTFEGEVITASRAAILFHGNYWEGALWLPRSQLVLLEDGNNHVIKVKPWLCNKKGLLEFSHYNEEQIQKMLEV